MKKKQPTVAELLARIEVLEKRLRDVEARPPVVINMPKDVPYQPRPYVPTHPMPWESPWCGRVVYGEQR